MGGPMLAFSAFYSPIGSAGFLRKTIRRRQPRNCKSQSTVTAYNEKASKLHLNCLIEDRARKKRASDCQFLPQANVSGMAHV
jgi:hypothetical protein